MTEQMQKKQLKEKKMIAVPKLDPETGEQMVDKNTGEMLTEEVPEGTIRKLKIKRPNGTTRIITDYSACPSIVDKSKAKVNDVNTLVKKYSTSQLDMLLKVRALNKKAIPNYDATQEPTLQEAKNEIVRLKQAFNDLNPKIRKQFDSLVDFLKFVDDPKNANEMVKMGLINLIKKESPAAAPASTTPTQT